MKFPFHFYALLSFKKTPIKCYYLIFRKSSKPAFITFSDVMTIGIVNIFLVALPAFVGLDFRIHEHVNDLLKVISAALGWFIVHFCTRIL